MTQNDTHTCHTFLRGMKASAWNGGVLLYPRVPPKKRNQMGILNHIFQTAHLKLTSVLNDFETLL